MKATVVERPAGGSRPVCLLSIEFLGIQCKVSSKEEISQRQ